MKVLVIGGTGFIGRYLVEKLLNRGHEVTIFSRNEKKVRTLFGNQVFIQQWKPSEYILLQEHAHKVHSVINLAGENIAAKRWTDYQKRKILSSRVNIGKSLSYAIQQSQDKPYILLQASAIGFYGFSETEDFTEDYIYEPSASEVLDVVLPKYLRNVIFGALLEAKASEFGSRMTAMDSATDNAEEMIEEFKLEKSSFSRNVCINFTIADPKPKPRNRLRNPTKEKTA